MRSNIGNNTVFRRAHDLEVESGQLATTTGVGIKTLLLIGVSLISALFAIFVIGPIGILELYFLIWIVTFVIMLVIIFRPRSARVLAVPYAILEGLTAGAISGLFAIIFDDLGFLISGLALAITMAIFLGASVLYLTGVVKVTNRLRRIMYTILIGALLTSLIVAIVGLFDQRVFELFYGANSILALGISILMVIVASIYVVISLDNANLLVKSQLDQSYEWYAAFGILINVIWLYYEVLRLIVIILGRNRN